MGTTRSVLTLPKLLAGLATQTELLNQLAIPVIVLGFEIVEQLTSLANHPEQTLTAVVIFLVLAEMLGELCYSLRQQCDLHFR